MRSSAPEPARHDAVSDDQQAAQPVARSSAEQALVGRFVQAWEAADPGAIVALLSDDAFVTMPPMPYRYDGKTLVGRFCAGLFDGGRRFDLVPTRANGQPALGAYLGTRPASRWRGLSSSSPSSTGSTRSFRRRLAKTQRFHLSEQSATTGCVSRSRSLE